MNTGLELLTPNHIKPFSRCKLIAVFLRWHVVLPNQEITFCLAIHHKHTVILFNLRGKDSKENPFGTNWWFIFIAGSFCAWGNYLIKSCNNTTEIIFYRQAPTVCYFLLVEYNFANFNINLFYSYNLRAKPIKMKNLFDGKILALTISTKKF